VKADKKSKVHRYWGILFMFIMMDKMANDIHETRSKHTHIERQQDMGHEYTVQGKKEKENRDGYAQMQKMQDASWNETEM
jgi:hypothetical protein